MSEVSAATEAKLREAMERLLAGQAINCDGQLTKANLAREAGVSRATMNRAHTMLLDWDRRKPDREPESDAAQKLKARLDQEMAVSRRLRGEIRQLKSKLSSAASVMLEMQALLNEQDAGDSVVPWKKRRTSE